MPGALSGRCHAFLSLSLFPQGYHKMNNAATSFPVESASELVAVVEPAAKLLPPGRIYHERQDNLPIKTDSV